MKTGNHRAGGFTLIELMIVIAIIAIIAAVAIPGILAATRAANERNASGSLKSFHSIEVVYKTSDSDQNGINDFWTGDIAFFYYANPVSGGTAATMIRLVEVSIAQADGNPITNYAIPAGPAHTGAPKSGYWYYALTDFETTVNNVSVYGNRHLERFGFAAVPNSYGTSGRRVFVISEGATMWKRDPGSQSNYEATTPTFGAQDPAGSLTANYATFPLVPSSATSTVVIGPWAKMD